MVLATSLVASFVVVTETPKEALENVIKHYQSLTSYSATIESHDGSGLFPGNYEQTLKWKKGGRFEIIVTKKSDYVPQADMPGLQAPDYFCNGTDVLMRRADGTSSVRSIVVDANTMPGWEVSTGLLLTWLQNSLIGRFLFEPPAGLKTEFSWGERKDWEGQPVREVLVTMNAQGDTWTVSLFLDSEKPVLIGQESKREGKRGWMRYRTAKENPDLPTTLGEHPK